MPRLDVRSSGSYVSSGSSGLWTSVVTGTLRLCCELRAVLGRMPPARLDGGTGGHSRTMLLAKLAALISALGCATAGIGLVASGTRAGVVIILAATVVASVAAEERGSASRPMT